jgi:acyl-CoA synthetase (AMP-forming)/AMP-acid ligase II
VEGAPPRARWRLRPPPPALAARYRAQGFWSDQTLGEFADAGLRRGAARELRVWSEVRPHRSTLGAERERALRLAAGLRGLGIGPGDPVAFQVPNWAEAALAFYAIALLGGVLVPIVHFYGRKELRFILEESGARALVTAARFRQTDYREGLSDLRRALPELGAIAVLGGEAPAGCASFEALLRADPLPGPLPCDPDAPAVVAYTSGTTADPKGVIHSHRTLLAEVAQLSATRPDDGRALLVGAPVAHGIGMLSGLLLPLRKGRPIHLIDVWEPRRVLEIMLEGDLSAGSGATYFLTSLLDHPDFTPGHLERMPKIGLGGAPVPAAVAERAERLGISIIRSYGSTEHPSTTGASHDEPAEKRIHTDGHALPGVELRLVDESGKEVPPGVPGEILSRGPDRFVGYTDPALAEAAIDAEGWYRSGDVGILDSEGWLTITDRVKDIIIRGGENVSAAEVEELLMRMPGVAEVAVVAAPDPRLGEHGCAFFRMQAGSPVPGLDAVRRHLARAGLAKQKWPEEIRAAAEFARTPSGKIKKFVLRDALRREAGGAMMP